MTPAIALAGVTRRFAGATALADVSLEVGAGEMFGLIGPDGAGKTTAIRLMCGLLRPDAGSVRVLGRDPVREHRHVTGQVGYLSQRFSLYGDLTVDENIAFFAEVHGRAAYHARRGRALHLGARAHADGARRRASGSAVARGRVHRASVREGRLRMKRLSLGLALALTTAAGAGAQDAPPLRLTLDEAQARALDASHRLAAERALGAAAAADVTVAAVAGRPSVALEAAYTRTNHVMEFVVPGPAGGLRVLYPDVPGNYGTRLGLRWPVYTGGRAEALLRAAKATAGATAEEVRVAQVDLRLDVARAFWALVSADAVVAVIARGVDRGLAHLSVAQERLANGLVAPNEVASARAQGGRRGAPGRHRALRGGGGLPARGSVGGVLGCECRPAASTRCRAAGSGGSFTRCPEPASPCSSPPTISTRRSTAIAWPSSTPAAWPRSAPSAS